MHAAESEHSPYSVSLVATAARVLGAQGGPVLSL